MTVAIIAAAVLTFALSAAFGPIVLPWLRKLKFGQSILEIGPSWHKNKQGTPTVGGIIFIVPILLVTMTVGAGSLFSKDMRLALSLVFIFLCALIGFADDYIKIVRKHNQGLTVRQKSILLLLVITLYVGAMFFMGYVTTEIYVPFFAVRLDLSYFYFIIIIPFLFFFVNSVNLTDGLDGLASSVTLPYAAAFIIVAMIYNAAGLGNSGLGVLAGAAVGGLLGFLIYNFHPAKVFMGDTGSLFLGGLVVALAMCYDMPYFILIGGIVYLLEGLSVVLQVSYFKLTHGKRIFKMTPIHHHFEMCKWSEVRIVIVFTLVSLLACAAALWGIVYQAAYSL